MANTILVGAQWGDEGKGKIIDVLTARLISLFEARAAITRGTLSSTVALNTFSHLIPSGILRRGKVCVIGNGVVIDPIALLARSLVCAKLRITIGRIC